MLLDNGPVVRPLAASSLSDRTTVIFRFEYSCVSIMQVDAFDQSKSAQLFSMQRQIDDNDVRRVL